MHCAYLHNNTSLQEKLSKIEKEQAETIKLVSKLQEEIIFLKSQTERFINIFKNSSHFSSHPLLRERLWSSSPSKHSRNPSPPSQIRTSPSPARISDCEEESDVTLSQDNFVNTSEESNLTSSYVEDIPDSWEDLDQLSADEKNDEQSYRNNVNFSHPYWAAVVDWDIVNVSKR